LKTLMQNFSTAEKDKPDDVWNIHGSIINRNTKIVNRLTIASQNDKISKCVRIPCHLAIEGHVTQSTSADDWHNRDKDTDADANCIVMWSHEHDDLLHARKLQSQWDLDM
jgi:hypothetical protein